MAWTGVQVVGERRHPPVLCNGAERFLVIRMGIADEDIVGLPRPVRHATLPGGYVGQQTYQEGEFDARWDSAVAMRTHGICNK